MEKLEYKIPVIKYKIFIDLFRRYFEIKINHLLIFRDLNRHQRITEDE